MRALLVIAVILFAGCAQNANDTQSDAEPPTHVFTGDYTRNEQGWSLPLAAGEYAALPVELVELTSTFDGITFPVGVYLPDVPPGTKVPAIVEITPYLPHPSDFDNHYQQDALEAFIPHGYAVVLVGMRGTTTAGGCMDLMGPGERSDAIQAMDWIADQEWFSGNASVIGLSYPGSTPWFLSAVGHPAVKTIVPMAGLTDTWELLFHNGTTEFGFWVPFFYWQGSMMERPTQDRVVCEDAAAGMATLGFTYATKERDPVYWSARESRSGTLAHYEGSVFLIHGFQDWNVDPHMVYPFASELQKAGIEVKHLLGQWDHTFPDQADDVSLRADFAEILLRWFDRELKGLDVDVGPMAQVQDNHMQWRSDNTWPPATMAMPLFLGADGTLSENGTAHGVETLLPMVGSGALCFLVCAPTYDPCDCPTFDMQVTEELRIAGMPRVHLDVTPTGPGGEIAAILFAQGPNGTERLGWGQIELHHAAGDGTTSPVVPGQDLIAKLALQPMDVVVEAGSTLSLQVFQGTYGDHYEGSPNYPVQLHLGTRSVVTLDTFTVPEAMFFDAPKWTIV